MTEKVTTKEESIWTIFREYQEQINKQAEKDAQLNYIKQQQIQEQYCYKPYRTLRNYLQ